MAEEKYGFNIELGLDSSKLNEGLSKVNKELKAEKADLTIINNQLKWDTNNIDAWRKKQTLLTSQIDKTKQKLKLQNQQLKLASKEFDGTKESEQKIKKLEQAIAKTTNEIGKMNRELNNSSHNISKLTGLNIGTFSKIGEDLNKFVTLPLIGAGTAVVGLAHKMANSLDDLVDNADKVGVNVEQYQQLIYATKILGGNTDSLQRAFIKVNAMLGDIADGKSLEVAQNISRIGLSVEDLKGKNTTEVFNLIRKGLANIEDETTRVAVANKIFGDRIGSEIMPLLKAEDSTIEALANEAKELGIATEDQIKLSGDYTDAVDRLKLGLRGVSLQIMEVLLPTMIELTDNITKNAIPKLKELIEGWKNLDDGTKKLVKTVGLLTITIGPTISLITKAVGVSKSLAGAFVTVKTATKALTSSISPLTVALGLVAAAFAYGYASDEEFRESIQDLGKTVLELMKPLGDLVKQLVDSFKPVMDTLIQQVLRPLLDGLLLPIMQILVDSLGPFLDILKPLLEGIMSVLKPMIDLIAGILVPALQLIGELLKPILDIVNKIFGTVGDFVKNVMDKLVNVFKKVGDFFGDMWENVTKGFDDWVESTKKALTSGNAHPGSYITGSGGTPVINTNPYGAMAGYSTSTYSTNNNVNVYTSSSQFDVDSINDALGGNYL